MNATVVYQTPCPRKLDETRGFRRDGKWRRKQKNIAGIPQPLANASHAHVMGWVLALITRRTANQAWDSNQAAALEELKRRTWNGFDIEKRRTMRRPTWFHRKWIPKRFWDFLALLVDAYREGTMGVMASFAELAAFLGVHVRTVIRWRKELHKRGLVTVVPTCKEASKKGRKRDCERNVYMLGPLIFREFGEAPMDGAGDSEAAQARYRKEGKAARSKAAQARAEEREKYRELVRRYDEGRKAPGADPAGGPATCPATPPRGRSSLTPSSRPRSLSRPSASGDPVRPRNSTLVGITIPTGLRGEQTSGQNPWMRHGVTTSPISG